MLSLGDQTVSRDWGWAPDYTRAMVLAATAAEPDDFVIATGETHTVGEFVEAAFIAAGVDDWRTRVDTDPRFVRPNDVSVMCGDPTKARQVLGWEPTMGFAEIVAAMVREDLS